MDALQCIRTRRSCRSYEDRPIPHERILELLTLGTRAATGSGLQPWGFAVLDGRAEIAALSDEIKAWLLENFSDFPYLAQYEEWLRKDSYNIFNKARYGVPETFRLVSVLSIGYAKGQMPEAAREAPRIFNR